MQAPVTSAQAVCNFVVHRLKKYHAVIWALLVEAGIELYIELAGDDHKTSPWRPQHAYSSLIEECMYTDTVVGLIINPVTRAHT